MTFQMVLLLPVGCALLYVISAMMVKRAVACGAGLWRMSFLSNWALVILFAPWWLEIDPARLSGLWHWEPFLAAICFLGGQIFTFLALRTGEVSVITPVMGAKVILVALGSSLLRVGEVPLRWWVGAVLSSVAIALLHLVDGAKSRQVSRAVWLTLASALSYSLSDVMLQRCLATWGVKNFLPPMFLFVGLFSFGFIPFFRAPLGALDARAWRWVGAGAGLLALTNAGIVYSIGLVGSATVVNILFSSRGLFSVLVVWLIGHWFSSEEQHLPRRVIACRLTGAALMVAAISLVLL